MLARARFQGSNSWPLLHPPVPSTRRGEDPLLASLSEPAVARQAGARERLFTEVAAPLIAQVIGRKAGRAPGRDGRFDGLHDADGLDAEDAASLARQRAWQELETYDPAAPIADFRGYCATIAFHAWAETLHRRYPSRRRLIQRVRYLCEGAAAARAGFAIWFEEGAEVAGLAADRTAGTLPAGPEVRGVIDQAGGFLQEHFRGQRFLQLDPAVVLRRVFGGCGGPLRWSDLEELLTALWEAAEGRAEGRPIDPTELRDLPVSPLPAPDERLNWLENLRWLWACVLTLTLPQRSAFLLHASVLKEFEYEGIASLRVLAAALEMDPAELARLWPEIPLDDLTLAARMGLHRQQVINLRKAARIALGRKLAEYLRK